MPTAPVPHSEAAAAVLNQISRTAATVREGWAAVQRIAASESARAEAGQRTSTGWLRQPYTDLLTAEGALHALLQIAPAVVWDGTPEGGPVAEAYIALAAKEDLWWKAAAS